MVDWRTFFSGGGDEQTLNFFPPVIRDNSFEIDPPSEVFNEGVSDWKLSLVGQFIGAAPNFVALRRIVASLWGKDALTKVSLAGSNLYVFSFANATARDWVLENGPWHIQHKPLILRKWEPNLQRLDFDLTHMLVWVQLYNVPLELYSKLGLSYIASGLGVPLCMDSITASREKLEFAKVCVEVPAGVRLPRVIPVKMRDKSVVTVKVKVPWMPASCSSCKSFGHSEKLCSEVKVGNMQATEWWAKGVDGVGAVDGAANSVPNAAIAQLGGDVTEFNGIEASSSKSDGCLAVDVSEVVGDAIGSSARVIEEFPPLQSPKVKGRGKGRGRGLKNRFEALQGVDPEEEVRKPRAASSGVMTLLQEMKAKKTEKVKAKVPVDGAVKEKGLQIELLDLEKAEAQYYQQKAKVDWLLYGDQGTRFFHSTVAMKRKRNTIQYVLDDLGNRVTSFEGIADEFIRFFTGQIGSVDEGVRGCTMGQLGDLLQATIPAGVKEALVRTVTSAEIKAAIFGQGTTTCLES
ncbi:hypothetical protein V6N13_005849 [Hibiscus sabdariffa]